MHPAGYTNFGGEGQICLEILLVANLVCDPPYDFRDKGDNTLTTRFHLKTKEIDFNTLTKHARAHFNELVLLSHITH